MNIRRIYVAGTNVIPTSQHLRDHLVRKSTDLSIATSDATVGDIITAVTHVSRKAATCLRTFIMAA
jgi:hypothetical protein